MDQKEKARAFRGLHVNGSPLVLVNVWDAGSAKTVTEAGAQAIGTSSWSVAHANGYEDGEQVPLQLVIENVQRIVAVTELPVTIDLERGYGDAEALTRTMLSVIAAGAVGCNLEDSMPDGSLRSASDQAQRIRRARAAADSSGLEFFINVRTDVFFTTPRQEHDDEAMLADALERARAYKNAGADGVFTPGLVDVGLIERLVEESPLPVNIMADASEPRLSDLAKCGVARVSYGPSPYIAAMRELERLTRATVAVR
jgi:2-methylisocitrate lyase-like PEP mutase family enzyme